ncbi:MAG: M20/M25/M40 family metallo-hydrolase [Treponema sp.]|jgi:amidohydrolase|nr:M20/M25/M40 family metallo-hydrolase [Treponema sp.]
MDQAYINGLWEKIKASIRTFREEAFRLGSYFFSIPETGFHEEMTARGICDCLEKWQIPCEKNLALHGVRCSFAGREEGYHVVIIADIDALLIQKDGKPTAFHSCGHSIQTVVLLNMIHAFAETKIMEQIPGRISFFFIPAEEFIEIEERKKMKAAGLIRAISGKQHLIAEGYFDDADAVLSCHVMNPDPRRPRLFFDVGTSLTGFLHKRIEFRGKDAHTGVAPHLGRNALHGASLSLNAIQMLKDTFPPEAELKLYPILSEGGGTSVNTIPSHAVLETYLRARDRKSLAEISGKLDVLFESCARALELGCSITTMPGYLPFIQDPALVKLAAERVEELCGELSLGENAWVLNETSGASGDHGDLSAIVPVLQLGFTGITGRVHSDEFSISDPVNAYENSALLLSGIALDLLLRPEKQIRYPDREQRKQAYLHDWLAGQDS